MYQEYRTGLWLSKYFNIIYVCVRKTDFTCYETDFTCLETDKIDLVR